MNTMHKKLERYLSRFEFSFSDKRIKISEPRYVDIQDDITTIIRDFDGFSLFACQGIVFIVYFVDRNEKIRKRNKNIPVDCVWEISIVNKDKSITKVSESSEFKFIERHILEYVNSEADSIF